MVIDLFKISACCAFTLYLLWVGSDFFIPLVIAVVIWYLIISIASEVHSIRYRRLYASEGFSLLIAIGICGTFLYLFFSILTKNISHIIHVLPVYQERLAYMTNKILALVGMEQIPNIGKILGQERVVEYISNIAQTLTALASKMGIIFLYVLFLILERESFDEKLAAMIRDPLKLQNTQEIIKKISNQIQGYIRIKTLLSLFVATVSYFVMRFVGVDFAGFWAQLIFFLNYIPTIGSIIATILPCLLTLLQFDSWYPFIIVTVTLTLIQFLTGNILEPKLIGKTVNLSGLVIIISLALWGKIWGITGMFLCVPIMVILNIIFAKFRRTRWIAVMLSAKGQIDEPVNLQP